MKCLGCGSSNLIQGSINDESGNSTESFKPNDKSTFLSYFGIGTRKILNFACVHCGNLQFIVDFTDADRERYADFAGQRQPDLIERLNSGDE